ncbi:MAG TPA: hypothetical protein DC049_06440 [Spirochaetia bacterium]|nr:hypothetical protein [Spirochaetia bacterium]
MAVRIDICFNFCHKQNYYSKKNPDLLVERSKYMQHKDAKPWDKILAPLVGLGGVLIPITAGIDAYYNYTVLFSIPVKVISLVIFH